MTTADGPPDAPGAGEEDADDLEVEIETVGVSEATVGEGTDPCHDRELVTAPCGSPRAEPRVFIRADALEKALDHTRDDMRNEVGGVLLGEFYRARGRLVTDVLDAMRAPATRAGVSHVTFSHETWSAIYQQIEPGPGRAIVGWYHSHPGIGVFLSKQDMFIHENFFDSDGHVALVVDPVKRHVVVYSRHEERGKKDVFPATGFWVSAPRDEQEKAERMAGLLHYRAPGGRERKGGVLGWLGGLLRRG